MTTAAAPLLAIDRLSVKLQSAPDRVPVAILSDVSLTIARNQTVALVGESGSGKSTLALSLLGLLKPSFHRGGSIRFTESSSAEAEPGRVAEPIDLATADERTLRSIRGARIAYLPQDPLGALNPLRRAGEHVVEAICLHRRSSRVEASARALEMLTQVGLDNPARCARRYPHQLSGGMRQRVLLACALANQPALLIADEPTSALDSITQAQILSLLGDLKRSHGLALLLITHDLGVAAALGDDLVILHAGRIVEHGPARVVLRYPAHPHTQELLAASEKLNGVAAREVQR